MKVLVTNDDGYAAEGLRHLARQLSTWADVVVVAPERNRSGCGHSITLGRPLRMTQVSSPVEGVDWYMVDGTPTDCINLGVHHLLRDVGDAAIASGVNHGVNLGDDVTYSGTVSGAFEGHLMGYPSVAVSQQLGEGPIDYERAARIGSEILRRAVELELAPMLNINVPYEIEDDEAGPTHEITWLGRRHYRDTVESREDPRGGAYFWLAGTPHWDETPGSDAAAVQQGRVSITPMQRDFTDHQAMDEVAKLVPPRGLLED